MVRQVAGAAALLHAQGMCHADIKPENLLLTAEGDIKLVDFGLSCERRDFENRKPGTWAYWPPEAYRGDQLGLPADMCVPRSHAAPTHASPRCGRHMRVPAAARAEGDAEGAAW